MIRAAVLLALAPLVVVEAAYAKGDPVVGTYRAAEGPDVASELVLSADGRFAFGLIAGSLDLKAKGRWVRTGQDVRLFTEPKPVAQVFSQDEGRATRSTRFSVLVAWPNGWGIAGIDVKIGFASGDPIVDYTQDTGWTLPDEETRTPVWIEFSQPSYGVFSPRFPIDVKKENDLRFTLTPNDMGTVDFQGAKVDLSDATLIVHHPDGPITFRRVGK